jgi:hypothetical protein
MQYLGILKTVGAENRMIASVYIICSLYSGKNMSEIHGAVSGFSGDLKQWFLGALKEMADSYRDANKDKNGAEVIKTDLDLAVMNMYALVYLLTSGNEVFSRVDGIFEWIVTGAKIEKGWNDANSGFRYGDGLISATSVSVLFAIAFHEIMHDVLFQKGYNCEYFRRQVIHEFLSDVCAFYGFCLMGLGDKILEYKEVFRYVKSLALAESSGGVMTQQHRAARAQLELVVEWFDSLNKELRRQSKAEKPLQDQFGYLLSIGVKNVLNEPDIRISNLTRRMVTGIFTDLDGQIFADIIDRPSSGRGGGKAVTLAMRAPTQVRRFVCGTRASGASL